MKFKSQLLQQASGSVGGLVYSHNRGGMYTRQRSIPVNPNSIRQQEVRAALTALVQAWDTILTQTQRDGWDLYGDNTPVLNTLGDPIILTGQQQYIRSNTPRIQAALARVDTAPVVFDTNSPVVAVPTFTEEGGEINVVGTITPAADGAGTAFLYVGRNQNVGRKFYKGPYQLAAIQAIADAAITVAFLRDTGSSAVYFSEYIPVVGSNTPIRIRISYADGRLSAPFELLQIVAAVI